MEQVKVHAKKKSSFHHVDVHTAPPLWTMAHYDKKRKERQIIFLGL